MKSNKRNKIGKITGMKPNVDGIAELKKKKRKENSSRVKNYEEFHH